MINVLKEPCLCFWPALSNHWISGVRLREGVEWSICHIDDMKNVEIEVFVNCAICCQYFVSVMISSEICKKFILKQFGGWNKRNFYFIKVGVVDKYLAIKLKKLAFVSSLLADGRRSFIYVIGNNIFCAIMGKSMKVRHDNLSQHALVIIKLRFLESNTLWRVPVYVSSTCLIYSKLNILRLYWIALDYFQSSQKIFEIFQKCFESLRSK
jgi:hypothetical protein